MQLAFHHGLLGGAGPLVRWSAGPLVRVLALPPCSGPAD